MQGALAESLAGGQADPQRRRNGRMPGAPRPNPAVMGAPGTMWRGGGKRPELLVAAVGGSAAGGTAYCSHFEGACKRGHGGGKIPEKKRKKRIHVFVQPGAADYLSRPFLRPYRRDCFKPYARCQALFCSF